MERSGAALAQFERELNVINPEEKTNILSARLLELNTEFTKAQADRVAKEAAWRASRPVRWRRPRLLARARRCAS
jgi:succinoglycan biosynthesis transport protein ExoP